MGITYNINEASAACGLSPSVLRIWEMRYGWPAPEHRGMARVYDEQQVEELTHVAKVVKSGVSIGSLIMGDSQEPQLPPQDDAPVDYSEIFTVKRIGFTILEPMSYNCKSQPLYREWMENTVRYMHDKYRYQDGPPLFTGPVEVLIRTNSDTRADADNLIKPLLDAVTRAGIWKDDRFVQVLTVRKGVISAPIHLAIWRWEPSE